MGTDARGQRGALRGYDVAARRHGGHDDRNQSELLASSRDTGRVHAQSRIVSQGARIFSAEGPIVDAKGRLLAQGTTLMVLGEGGPSIPDRPEPKSQATPKEHARYNSRQSELRGGLHLAQDSLVRLEPSGFLAGPRHNQACFHDGGRVGFLYPEDQIPFRLPAEPGPCG